MHYFITGHTGFKGSWLVALLKQRGHEVSGYSLPPLKSGLFELAGLEEELRAHTVDDIRDASALKKALRVAQPDVVMHLAAQPLVLESFNNPAETYTTNVNGTLNLLEAVTDCPSVLASLVITTDKVYRDTGNGNHSELDPLGGHDPYSASKAMADILTQSWAETHPSINLHVARAGNVVGAFDVSLNRLLPDILRGVKEGKPVLIRHPDAVRPWQHVLDCLDGYLAFLNAALEGHELPIPLNFGPDPEGFKSVRDVLEVALKIYPQLKFETSSPIGSQETKVLTLNSEAAKRHLGWGNKVPFQKAIESSLKVTGQPRDLLLKTVAGFETSERRA